VDFVHLLFKILLIVFSVGLILVVLLQKGKSAGLSGAISGGAEQLFGKQKARGLDLFMSRLTLVLASGFFVFALLVSYVFTK
jgi:preprotein translocase subunit SecG